MNLIIKTETEELLNLEFVENPTPEQRKQINVVADKEVAQVTFNFEKGVTVDKAVSDEGDFFLLVNKTVVTVK